MLFLHCFCLLAVPYETIIQSYYLKFPPCRKFGAPYHPKLPHLLIFQGFGTLTYYSLWNNVLRVSGVILQNSYPLSRQVQTYAISEHLSALRVRVLLFSQGLLERPL